MRQNNKPSSYGIYANLIFEYIEYKRSLGYKMGRIEEALSYFDKFATEWCKNKFGINKELIEEWSKPFPMESEHSRYFRISALRGFSTYLQILGYESYIPKLPKYIESTFTPHIFTKYEIANIFRECDKLRVNGNFQHSLKCIIPSLIRVLYGTGIRIGEAMNLKHSDVNLDDGFLHLRSCKNNQDRVVPLSLSVREVCKDYLMYKHSIGLITEPDTPFFTSGKGTTGTISAVYQIFRIILYRAGIPHGGKGKGPRLHDLRHTFCVNTLVQLSEKGLDLYYSLPILMTYIGHQSISATNRYVRLTEEMYPILINKVDETYRYVFPNLGLEITDEYEND